MARVDAIHTVCVYLFHCGMMIGRTVVCWSSDPHCRLPRKGIGGRLELYSWGSGRTFKLSFPSDSVVYRPGGCRFDLWCYEG